MDFTSMTKEELINYINNLTEVTSNRFGLRWDKEKNKEQIVLDCDKYLPILTEDEEKRILGGPLENILIEGDNFHALTTLNYTHASTIDVIYIDPPYNTGNKDFKYNDNYVDLEDGYRHSKWLNFMEKRLILAKNLLKSDGLIFISIDDNELYQLKLLCDQIFSETNFIANLVIETASGVFGTRASQTNKTFVKVKDYVLVYAKNKTKITREFMPLYVSTKESFDPHYSIMLDEDLNRLSLIDYLKQKENIKAIFKKYNLKININNISKLMQLDEEFNQIIIEDLASHIYQDVSFSLKLPPEIEEELSHGKTLKYNDYIIFKTKEGKGTTRQYIPFSASLHNTDEYQSEYKKTVVLGDLWKNFDFDMKNVSKEGGFDFKNGKKPVRLIKQLLKWTNIKNAQVLDFFAGSGTTAQAVMELNKEDGGNRRFILCTNNENNICTEITYPRIKNVIDNKNSLRYYKTSFIENTNNKDQLCFDLYEKITPMLCIKNQTFYPHKKTDDYIIYKNQSENKYTAIYFDLYETSLQEFIDDLKKINQEKIIYLFSLGNYIDEECFTKLQNYTIELLPQKIIDLYRKIVKSSKKDY